MYKRYGRLAAVFIAAGLTACSAGPQQGVTPPAGPAGQDPSQAIRRPMDTFGGIGNASMSISLGDAPPVLGGKTLAHLYIGLVRVDAVSAGSSVTIASASSPYVMDVLAFQNGAAQALARTMVSAQQYTALRVVIATGSSSASFTDGSTLPLNFETNQGSASSAGAAQSSTTTPDATPGDVDVMIPIDESLSSGESDTMQIDFNAMESLALGTNALTVRPSVFAASAAGSGAIAGSIVNQSGAPVTNAVVAAIAANGSVANTAATDANGNYSLHGLPAGTYSLQIYNSYENAAGGRITSTGASANASSIKGPSVTVTAGSTQNAGSIAD